MKILFINNEYPPIGGGGSILTSYVAINLVKKGHEVLIITSSFQDLPAREEIDGYTVIRIPALRKKQDSSSYLELVSFVLSSLWYGPKYIQEFKPDLIQAFFAVPAGASAFILSKMFHISYAVYLGGSDVPGANPIRHKMIYPFITPIIKIIVKHSQFVAACSDMLVDLIHKHLPAQKIIKIPNGVDTTTFTPPKKKPNPSTLEILGVGRIMPRKGFQFLLEAAGGLPKELKNNYHITLIGSGDYKSTLRQMVKDHKLGKNVTFVDSIPYDELRNYYQKAHIFALPSLAEGMPLAMIEAMGCGCALLSTDVAGNQELVKQGKNGYIVAPGNIPQLQEKLQLLLENPKQVAEMGKESREMSLAYDWESITKVYIKYYLRIVKK